MEVGKCYVDGEGFYKVIHKPDEKTIMVEAVTTKEYSVSYFNGITFNEKACRRRMVECPVEVFETAKSKAKAYISELYEYNSRIFYPLWKNKQEKKDGR